MTQAAAGLALDAERRSRRVLALPHPDTLAQLRPALERVLGEPSFERGAGRLAESIRALAPVEEAPAALEELAATPPRPRSRAA